MPTADVLKDVPLFEDLDEADLARVAEALQERRATEDTAAGRPARPCDTTAVSPIPPS